MNPNQRVIEEYFDSVWSRGDMQAQEQLIAPDYTGYWLIAAMPVRQGVESHKAWVQSVRAGLTDAHYTIHEIIMEDSRATARVTLGGNHSGTVAGRAPTGKFVTADQIFMFHLAGGQICKEWVSFDRDSFMKQLEPTTSTAQPA